MAEICGDTEDETITLEFNIKKVYDNAKVVILAQYTRINPKVEEIAEKLINEYFGDEDEE